MVKKVTGNKPPGGGPTEKIERSRPVGTAKVGDVSGVEAPQKQSSAARVRRPTRPMTAAERERLFQLIHEEAGKMFGPNGLPESQRTTVEDAVRKTVDASIVSDEEEQL
ncbi:MAG: hypothetical protein KDD44_00365 [Bdellovibrionales bacterium]|nr:hypothetical protein [Bdellovibrionales bacterium]